MKSDLSFFLLVVIFLGITARFYGLDQHFVNGDEEFYIIAAEKFRAGSDYDVRLWNYHAPPVAKYIMSLPLWLVDADYSVPYAIPPNLFVFNYLVYESIEKVYASIRTASAIFGTLFIIFIFLIGRELFGTKAGLWAAASAAISIDYIILSRLAMVDIYLYAFIASTIFFYIMYKKSPRKNLYLVCFFFSLILMFGSKNLQSLIVLPPILYTEIVGNKKSVISTLKFIFVVGLAWIIHSSLVYPPEISKPAYDFFTSGQASKLVYPETLPTFFLAAATTNSYFFLFSFIAVLVYYSKKAGAAKIKGHLTNPTPYSMIVFLAAFSLLVFSVTTLNQNSKYITQMAIPFFLLAGYIMPIVWGKKILRAVFLLVLAVSSASVVLYSPSYEEYPGQKVISFSSEGRTISPQMALLMERGNPPIVTNSVNMLIFYTGKVVPLPVKNSPECTPEFLSDLKAKVYMGVFRNIGNDEKQFLCEYVLQYKEVFLEFSNNMVVSY